MAERCLIPEAAEITGLPQRTLIDFCAKGRIPGAAKLGRRWTLNVVKLRAWIREREDATCPKTFINEEISTGAGSRFAGKTSDEAYERLLS